MNDATQVIYPMEAIGNLKRSRLEVLAINVLIPILALTSIGICALPAYAGVPAWVIFVANFALTTQIAILTHELIHVPDSATRFNWLLRINLHLYSPFTVGFAEYKRLHSLHHQHANDPASDPDYFFIRGGRLRAFLTLAFAPEYLFWHVLRTGETQRWFWPMHVVRIAVFALYIYYLGLATFLLLFFLPAKLAWGTGFLLFSYESHVDEHGERNDTFNLEPRSAFLRWLLKALVGPYAYYVAFSHASHHVYPQVSGRKIGVLTRLLRARGVELRSRDLKVPA